MANWIRTPEALAGIAPALLEARALALDSESDSLYHHFEKVCLIQLATDRGDAWLIDPLALRDLQPLAELFADPKVPKVLHGADYDVTTLKRDFGFEFAGLFDTMIAARFLGLPEIGLQAVARSELGIEISKGSQKDDWSRRPLTPVQEAYALADVQHLLALKARLEERLAALGRLAWVEEECAAVAALPAARRVKDAEAFKRVKGAGRLPRRALAVLRELVAWRDALAAAGDIPAFKVLGNEALLTIATAAPKNPEDMMRLRVVPSRRTDYVGALLSAVAAGLAVPERDLPLIPRERRPAVPEAVQARVSALKAWRTEEAARAQLDPSVILPQRLIDRLVEVPLHSLEGIEQVEGLRRWRIATYGPALLHALTAPARPPGDSSEARIRNPR